jgi:Rrf2 family protein
MLQITKKADYAVRLMLEVASHSGGAITTAEIAKRQDIPYPFLRKVAQTLATKGLLASERGGKGGLTLARPAEGISVLDILQALDLPPLNDCAVDPDDCVRREICAVYPVWFEAQREMERVLGGTALSKLVRAHRVLQSRADATERGQTAPIRGSKGPILDGPRADERRNGNPLELPKETPVKGGWEL